ncbi:unnamed protein product [Allacma fusca]|uniref:G-patch domain-containing protein n=1 Tax=Allacma fusca TaxID=39272 RepID=A0A8J2K9G8_9HEXA|nr:unnamed protein product [Allacma fusca]
MSEKASSTSLWLKFFRGAGIPSGIDTKYALIFDENRIRMDMLMDLNKEILRDMGIVAMGDIIAILKHARRVHDETKEQAVEPHKPTQSQTSNSPSKVLATSTQGRSSGSSHTTAKPAVVESKKEVMSSTHEVPSATRVKISTTAGSSRVTERVVQSKGQPQAEKIRQEAAPKKMIVLNKRSSSEGILKEEVPVQKKIRVLPEQEGRYTIKMPEGTTPRTKKIIQSRLGPGPTTSTFHSIADKKTVFARLGDSSVSSSTEDARAASQPVSDASESRAYTSQTSKQSVFDRLGGRGKQAEGSDTSTSASSQPKPLLQMKVNVPEHSSSVRSRLDTKTHQEKTLKTIPSRISIPYLTNRAKVRSEIGSAVTSATTSTTTRIISAKSSVPASTIQSTGAFKIQAANDQKRSRENSPLDGQVQTLTSRSQIASQVSVPVPLQQTARNKDEGKSYRHDQQYANCEGKQGVVFNDQKIDSNKDVSTPVSIVRSAVSVGKVTQNRYKESNIGPSLETFSKDKHTNSCGLEDSKFTPAVRITWRAKDESTYRITRTGIRSPEGDTDFSKYRVSAPQPGSKLSKDERTCRDDSIADESNSLQHKRSPVCEFTSPPRASASRDRDQRICSLRKNSPDKFKSRSGSTCVEHEHARSLKSKSTHIERKMGNSLSSKIYNEDRDCKRTTYDSYKSLASDKYHSFDRNLLSSHTSDTDSSSERCYKSGHRKSSDIQTLRSNTKTGNNRHGNSSFASKLGDSSRDSSVRDSRPDNEHKLENSGESEVQKHKPLKRSIRRRSTSGDRLPEKQSSNADGKRNVTSASRTGSFRSNDRSLHRSSRSSAGKHENRNSAETSSLQRNSANTLNEYCRSRKSSCSSNRSSRSRSRTKYRNYYDSDESAASGKHDRVNPKLDPERNYKSQTSEIDQTLSQIKTLAVFKPLKLDENKDMSKNCIFPSLPAKTLADKATNATSGSKSSLSPTAKVGEIQTESKGHSRSNTNENPKKSQLGENPTSPGVAQTHLEKRSCSVSNLESVSDLELSDESQILDSIKAAPSKSKTEEPPLRIADLPSTNSLLEGRYLQNTFVVHNDQWQSKLVGRSPNASKDNNQSVNPHIESNDWPNKEDFTARNSSQDCTIGGSRNADRFFVSKYKSEEVRHSDVKHFSQSHNINSESNNWNDCPVWNRHSNDRNDFSHVIPRDSGKTNVVMRIRREIKEVHSSLDSFNNTNIRSPSKIARYSERQDDRSLLMHNSTFAYSTAFVKETNFVECNNSGEEIIRITRPLRDKDEFIPDTKSVKMMEKMGWAPGLGLGKNKQGRKRAVESGLAKLGNYGLGFGKK